MEKRAVLPAAWAEEKYPQGYDDYLARHDLPELPDDIRGFDSFYIARKRRLARRLATVLGVDPDAAEALVATDDGEDRAAFDLTD